MTLLIVILRGVVEGIDLRVAFLPNDGVLGEVGRDSEGTSCTALAVGAVADTEHEGARVYSDR